MRNRLMKAAVVAVCLSIASPSLGQVDNFCLPTYPEFSRPPRPAPGQPRHLSFNVLQQGSSRILAVEGPFGVGEGERFENALRSAGAVDEVWLSSGGGNVDSGLALGRALRKHGLFVRVPKGFACISSCTIAFLGGQLRTVDDGAYYGVHMFSVYSDEDRSVQSAEELRKLVLASDAVRKGTAPEKYQRLLMNIEQEAAQGAAEWARYFVEMSASLELMTSAFGQSQQGVCFLTPAGLKRYNVTNI